jgi:hypothetical protein
MLLNDVIGLVIVTGSLILMFLNSTKVLFTPLIMAVFSTLFIFVCFSNIKIKSVALNVFNSIVFVLCKLKKDKTF